jgi:hypothetical protein
MRLNAAGICCIPILTDGSKKPAVAWKRYQAQLPTDSELNRWFDRDDPPAYATLGGKVSGGLEQIDFDGDSETNFPEWCQVVENEAPDLVPRLNITRTPRQPCGFHVRYRCTEVEIPGNTKLAEKPSNDPETGKPTRSCLIETRGEGGYTIGPDSPAACHPTGRPYVHESGPPIWELPTISAAEREILIRCARAFNQCYDDHEEHQPAGPSGSVRPGDDFSARGPDWSAILDGWTCVLSRGGTRYWKRPGKMGAGWSATTGHCRNGAGHELFACFSENAHPFQGASNGKSCTCYSKFAAYAFLKHNGNFAEAARHLATQGYGKQRGKTNGKAHTNGHVGGARNERPPEYHDKSPPCDTDETAFELAEEEDSPHRVANAYLEEHRQDGVDGVHVYRGEPYRFDRSCYRCIDPEDFKAQINASAKKLFNADCREKTLPWLAAGANGPAPKSKRVTRRLTADVVEAIAGLTLIEAHEDEPIWLVGEPPADPSNLVACRNCLVDVAGWERKQPCQYPLTPRFFSQTALEFDFDPNPPPPSRWFDFLEELWGTDLQAIETLQEMFGYLLSPDTSQQKTFFLLGPPRSGKGTVARILIALLGSRNVCGPTLASMGQNFGLQPLLGKRLAIVSDARIDYHTDQGVLIERLLAISGEDRLSIPRKYLSAVEIKLLARLLILSNELPRLKDASGALASRFIMHAGGPPDRPQGIQLDAPASRSPTASATAPGLARRLLAGALRRLVAAVPVALFGYVQYSYFLKDRRLNRFFTPYRALGPLYFLANQSPEDDWVGYALLAVAVPCLLAVVIRGDGLCCWRSRPHWRGSSRGASKTGICRVRTADGCVGTAGPARGNRHGTERPLARPIRPAFANVCLVAVFDSARASRDERPRNLPKTPMTGNTSSS